jgi:hypothetical protein
MVPATPPNTNHTLHGPDNPHHHQDNSSPPLCTKNGLLYYSKTDGGIGIPKLEVLTSSSALREGVNLLNPLDPATQAICIDTKLEYRATKYAKVIRLP